jgi:hypothetical protein
MSSTALDRTLICAGLVLASTTVLASNSQPLSCETVKVEETVLQQAPEGARRVEAHVLVVTTKKGQRRFVDTPSRDESATGGVHWRYCGFDPQAKAHLIERMDEGAYSGNLLLDESGEQMPAGHTVLFSPSGREFLAIEQEAGEDGEEWAVYDMAGKTLWKGYAGTQKKVDGIDSVVSVFAHPQWTRQGQLTARYECASSKLHGVVALVRSPSGNWGWHAHGKCS